MSNLQIEDVYTFEGTFDREDNDFFFSLPNQTSLAKFFANAPRRSRSTPDINLPKQESKTGTQTATDKSTDSLLFQLKKAVNTKKVTKSYLTIPLLNEANHLIDLIESNINKLRSQISSESDNEGVASACVTCSTKTQPPEQINEAIQTSPTTSRTAPNNAKKSFAEALKGNLPKQRPSAILLYPKEKDSFEGPLREFLSEEVPSSHSIFKNVRKLNKIKNNGIAVIVNNKLQQQEFLEELQNIPSIQTKESPILPAVKHPSSILYNIPNNVKEEEIQKELKTVTHQESNLKSQTSSHPLLTTSQRLFAGSNNLQNSQSHSIAVPSPILGIPLINSLQTSSTELKLLQINLGRTKAAANILQRSLAKIQPDLLLAQEPYISKNEIQGIPANWNLYSSINQKAIIVIPPGNISPIIIDKRETAIAIKIHTEDFPLVLISAYSSPAGNIERTLEDMQTILAAAKYDNVMICADLNGHHSLWGYNNEETRGKKILDFALANNLYITNSRDAPPTLINYNGTHGWPDLTLCTHNLIPKVSSWEVLEDVSNSDHSYIKITLASRLTSYKLKRYKTLHGNHKTFLNIIKPKIAILEDKIVYCDTPEYLNQITQELQNEIISACNKAFKIKSHNVISNPTWWTSRLEADKNKLQALRRRAQRTIDPIARKTRFQQWKRDRTLYMRQKVGKNPKLSSSYRPIALLPTIGKTLEKLLTQRLMFHLESENKLNQNQHGFRTGKSVDTAISYLLGRIHQGRREKNHVLALSLDTKGAFDNILHQAIVNNLSKAEVPSNLRLIFENILKNRKVLFSTQEGTVSRNQEKGCPQGSCSGPVLWNIVVNDLLNKSFPPNCHIQAYADDIVLVTKSPTREGLKLLTNNAISIIINWADENSLTISHEKSNFLLLSKLAAAPPVSWKNHRIKRSHSIKFLGLYIDDKLNWNTQLRSLSQAQRLHQIS
ncbi:Putative protein in type-1 retrotransposable element R1DM [Araneus ventricosus]|uniref:Reverse transcriptase domain-containing protein n=1 Tax=Araneus ventricosus TaxID=182803 RepID=A0A4Y2RGK8_ARAVE|nr:Putative protein in type-1 retrotransposable element R1DM [Araneus ventricosus]